MMQLWFDVENIRDTTTRVKYSIIFRLWFDVENIRDTTNKGYVPMCDRCGLM